MTYNHTFYKINRLYPLQELTSRPVTTARLNRNSKVFKIIINAIHQKKGENVVSLDLRKINEAVADFFIICEATTNTQVRGIADFIQDELKTACQEIPYKHEGYGNGKWILIDYVNVVVHIMQPETRQFYQLEEMWSDTPSVIHEES